MSCAKCKADEERDDQRREAPQEPPPELDQMLEQRLLGVVDVLHGSGRFSGGSSSPGWFSSNGSVGSAGVGDRRHLVGLARLGIMRVRRMGAA